MTVGRLALRKLTCTCNRLVSDALQIPATAARTIEVNVVRSLMVSVFGCSSSMMLPPTPRRSTGVVALSLGINYVAILSILIVLMSPKELSDTLIDS